MRKKNGAADDDKPSSAEMNDLNAMLQVRVCVCVDLRPALSHSLYALPHLQRACAQVGRHACRHHVDVGVSVS